MNIQKDIIRLSDRLDTIGLHKEANLSDDILKDISNYSISNVNKKLISLANSLDNNGFEKEADYIDLFIKKYAFLFGLPDGSSFLKDVMFGGAAAIIKMFKEEITSFVSEKLGIEDKSIGEEIVSSFIEALEGEDILTILTSNDRCEIIAEYLIEAIEGVIFSEKLIQDIKSGLEVTIEDSIQDIFGLKEEGILDNFVEDFIDLSMIEEKIRALLSNRDQIIPKISEGICDIIRQISGNEIPDREDEEIEQDEELDANPLLLENSEAINNR